jgi:sulfhydrogenase subunit beta (sulfur reductase)
MNSITKDCLRLWLNQLVQRQTLIAPHDIDGILLYKKVKSSEEIVFNYIRPKMSPKEYFFPPTEQLFTINFENKCITIDETIPEINQIIFGIRPCDAHGLKILDDLFIETEPSDPYFINRRKNTLLIGLACKKMGDTCFCDRMGIAADNDKDVDVMLYETDDNYLVKTITENGRLITIDLLVESENILDSELTSDNQASLSNDQMLLPNPQSWPSYFTDVGWERLSERCLSCRVCAYVCPTCRCFIVRDEDLQTNGKQYERIRCWDSCTGSNYRKIAGGHNPRPDNSQRLRNRFFCKFYYYPEQYGSQACTGCGRCIDSCPVNIDITEVLDYLITQKVIHPT